MRKGMKTLVCFSLLFTATFAMAVTPKIDLVGSNTSKEITFKVGEEAAKMTLTLTDAYGVVVYAERINAAGINKKFDLKQLDNGTYYFKTSSDIRTIAYTITVVENAVQISDRKEYTKPFFKKSTDRMTLNFLNTDASDVSLKVYDDASRLVFSEDYKNTMVIEKAFNFTKAYAGNYMVVLNDGGLVYSDSFEVK